MIERQVRLEFITDLMFDAYRGQKDIPTEEKLYYGDDHKSIIVPAANIQSAIALAGDRWSRYNRTGKPWTELGGVAASCILISPAKIPILRRGKPVVFEAFGKGGFAKDVRKAGGGSGGGNTKIPPMIIERPTLSLPIALEFQVRLVPNEYLSEEELRHWFDVGGVYAGLLNGRRIGYGKFKVVSWE